ncbi:MAG: Csp1 family four helix bundle copper storage protein [Gammaproteobacteria bacterium]
MDQHTPLADRDPTRSTRRAWLGAAGALGAGLAVAARAEDTGHHAHHSAGARDLVAAASHCVTEADVCDQHCLAMFRDGDKSLVDCAARVRELAALCTAAGKLAVQESPRLDALLDVCAESCKACEDECRKHEAKHEVCKTCADACVAMVEAIAAHKAAA